MFSEIWKLKERYSSETYMAYSKKFGIQTGEGCRLCNSVNTTVDVQNPRMILIGENVRITKGSIVSGKPCAHLNIVGTE